MAKARKSKRIQRDYFPGRKINAIISVDPGKKSGVTVVTVGPRPRLLFYELAKFGLKRTPLSPSKMIAKLRERFDVGGVVIEDQYLGFNPNSMKVVTRLSGRWEEAADSAGLPVEFVGASTWQGATLKRTGRVREQLKSASQTIAQLETGIELSEDLSDSYCMGRYVAIEMCQDTLCLTNSARR